MFLLVSGAPHVLQNLLFSLTCELCTCVFSSSQASKLLLFHEKRGWELCRFPPPQKQKNLLFPGKIKFVRLTSLHEEITQFNELIQIGSSLSRISSSCYLLMEVSIHFHLVDLFPSAGKRLLTNYDKNYWSMKLS